jgi:hypothetical protein
MIKYYQCFSAFILALFRNTHRIFFMLWDGQGMWCVLGWLDVCTACWWGSLREIGHWGVQKYMGG